MRNMSFAKTTAQIRNMTKTVTRRFGWWDLKPGDVVQPVKKGMGLKKGEKVEKIGDPIRILETRKECVGDVTESEVVLEGFPGMTPKEFMLLLTDNWKKGFTHSPVNRILFEYVGQKTKVWQIRDWLSTECCGLDNVLWAETNAEGDKVHDGDLVHCVRHDRYGVVLERSGKTAVDWIADTDVGRLTRCKPWKVKKVLQAVGVKR